MIKHYLIFPIAAMLLLVACTGTSTPTNSPATDTPEVEPSEVIAPTDTPEPTPAIEYPEDYLTIEAIQGDDFESPYEGERVTTGGVITAIFPALGGFWIQTTETDDDPETSAGLFIDTSRTLPVTVAVGDFIFANGYIRENFEQTILEVRTPSGIEVLTEDNVLPAPIELDPPADMDESMQYFEAYEGMLVQVSGPAIAVAPTSRFGEYVVVLPYHDVERLWRNGDNGMAIMVNDGASDVHETSEGLPYTIATGDQVSGLIGPLAYSYGQYKIEPLELPQVVVANTEPPSLTPTSLEEFSLMTWNVENLFDTELPNPDSPRMPDEAEYQASIAKVANTIVAAGVPTIVALQEVENIGVLETIAAHPALADYGYQAALVEGNDGRGIDVGYLVRGDTAEIVSIEQFNAPNGLTSRPPLLIEVRVTTNLGTVKLYVLNNHFKSMSGGEAETEPRRIAQAEWNVGIIQSILATQPHAYIILAGDLNAFYDAAPIDVLRDAGLEHTYEMLPEDQRYTYIFEGRSQVLDHIMVTPSLMALLRRVEPLRSNADYGPPTPGDESIIRASDHDAMVATFSLGP